MAKYLVQHAITRHGKHCDAREFEAVLPRRAPISEVLGSVQNIFCSAVAVSGPGRTGVPTPPPLSGCAEGAQRRAAAASRRVLMPWHHGQAACSLRPSALARGVPVDAMFSTWSAWVAWPVQPCAKDAHSGRTGSDYRLGTWCEQSDGSTESWLAQANSCPAYPWRR